MSGIWRTAPYIFFYCYLITFGPEVVSKELESAIKKSLQESHEKVRIYSNNPSVANSEEACWANRKTILYLYLARFGYQEQETVRREELRTFRTDMNIASITTVFYNRLESVRRSNTSLSNIQIAKSSVSSCCKQSWIMIFRKPKFSYKWRRHMSMGQRKSPPLSFCNARREIKNANV